MTGKLLAYHLKSPRVPLVVRVPQFENHWNADITNSGQMRRKYKSGAIKRKLRAEQEKRDEQIKKKMPRLLTYGFETSLISNNKRKTKKS